MNKYLFIIVIFTVCICLGVCIYMFCKNKDTFDTFYDNIYSKYIQKDYIIKDTKNIFCYWKKDIKYSLINECVKNIEKTMKDWKIILLNDDTIYNLIDKNKFPSNYTKLNIKTKIDWIKLYLIYNYGGLYVDLPIIINPIVINMNYNDSVKNNNIFVYKNNSYYILATSYNKTINSIFNIFNNNIKNNKNITIDSILKNIKNLNNIKYNYDVFYNIKNKNNIKNVINLNFPIKLKFLNLILYSENNPEYVKMKKYLTEYLKLKNIRHYFYCYKKDLKKNYEIIDNVVYIKGIENIHPGCTDKTLKVFSLFENEDYNFIIRSNISTIVNFEILEKEIFDKDIIYGSSLINKLKEIDKPFGIIDKKYFGTLFPSGVCIILCKNLVKLIVKNQELIRSYNVIDDLSIGIYLKDYKLKNVSQKININNTCKDICVYRNKRDDRKEDVQIMKNILHELTIDKKIKTKTFNCLIATIGRKTLQNMLNSLSGQLSKDDCLTIVFDGHSSIPYFDISKFKCKVNQYFEPVALKFAGHGIRNKYKNLLEKRDFILHADDDDIYVDDAFDYLRKNCIDEKTLYIVLMKNKNNIYGKIIKMNFIGTPCGIIPYEYNKNATWGCGNYTNKDKDKNTGIGGDGLFYEELARKYKDNIIFLNKIIYMYLK